MTISEKIMNGIDLTTVDKETADILKHFDKDGDNWVDHKEIIKGAEAFKKSVEKNTRQKKVIHFLMIGYLTLVLTVSGLVYGMLKLTQETRLGNGNVLMSNSQNSKPISINTNEVSVTLGMIPFLPSHVTSKIDKFSFSNDETILHRMVQSIDVIPEKGFVITSTAGDTVVWDSNINNEWMQINLANGIVFKKHVGCSQCSVINFANDGETDEALQLFDEFLDTIGGANRRDLQVMTGACLTLLYDNDDHW
jgi:hypothetical protein